MERCFTDGHDFFDASKLFLDQQRGAVVAAEAFGLTREEKGQWKSTESYHTEGHSPKGLLFPMRPAPSLALF